MGPSLRQLRKAPTQGEVLLWRCTRRKATGHEFHRRVLIDRFIVDVYCPELRLAIEVGGSSHDGVAAMQRDALRQARLEALG